MIEKTSTPERVNGKTLIPPVDMAINVGLLHWGHSRGQHMNGLGDGAAYFVTGKLIEEHLPANIQTARVVNFINQVTHELVGAQQESEAPVELFNEALLRLTIGLEAPEEIRDDLAIQDGYSERSFELAHLAVTGKFLTN